MSTGPSLRLKRRKMRELPAFSEIYQPGELSKTAEPTGFHTISACYALWDMRKITDSRPWHYGLCSEAKQKAAKATFTRAQQTLSEMLRHIFRISRIRIHPAGFPIRHPTRQSRNQKCPALPVDFGFSRYRYSPSRFAFRSSPRIGFFR